VHVRRAVLLALLAATPLAAQSPSGWREATTAFDQYVRSDSIVGASLVYFVDGRIVAEHDMGWQDRDAQVPADSNTIWHWGSITKTLTGIAIMQLRDRGRLRLTDPIVRYVPELRKVHDPYGDVSEITIGMLMSHAAGFRNSTWPWGGDQPWQPFEPTDWSQLVAMMPYTEILFPPGSKYSYSNPGIIFLGRTIEGLTDDDFEVYMEKNVLRPLDMRSAYYDITPYHLLEYRSNNYTMVDGSPKANGLDFDTGITTSNGGLNASLPDMVKYLQFLVGAPGLSVDARNVLARSSLEEMWRPVLPLAPGSADSIGRSYFIYHRNGLRLLGHTGSQAAFRSFFYLDPVSRTGVIAAFNTAPADDPRNPPDAEAAKPRIGVIFDGLLDRLAGSVFPYFRP